MNQNKPIDLLFLGSWDMELSEIKAASIQVSEGMVVNDLLNNVRIGTFAGQYRTTGVNNTCFGNQALRYLTAGYENIAIGSSAMIQASGANCSYNIALGNSSMHDALNCTRCISLGYFASYGIVNATDCVALGTNAAFSVQNANRVIAIGNYAAQFCQSDDTICIGYNAGKGTGPGAYLAPNSVYIGNSCGEKGGDAYNTCVGFQCGKDMVTGAQYNSLLGYRSGYKITTADQMTAIGYNCALNMTTGGANQGRSVMIGSECGYWYNGHDSVMVGVGCGYGPGVMYDPTACVYIGRDCGRTGGGPYNVAIGYEAGYSMNGSAQLNCLMGYQVGRSLTSGASNSCIGYQAGYSLTTNNSNVMIGHAAGLNVDGAQNVMIGKSCGAGAAACSPTNCVWIGFAVGADATGSAQNNIGIGMYALRKGGGHSTVAIGYATGAAEVPGVDLRNVYIGTNCGISNASDPDNVFIGTNTARLLNSGADNVIIGSCACETTPGTLNAAVCIGFQSSINGELGFDSTQCTALGYRATIKRQTRYATAIGANSNVGELCDNSIAIGRSAEIWNTANDCVSIGTDSTIKASVAGIALGRYSTIGNAAHHSITIGSNATISDGGDNSIAIGQAASCTGNGALAIGNSATAAARVARIGTSNYYTNFIYGSVGAITQDSDRRFKTQITPIGSAKRLIRDLQPVRYKAQIDEAKPWMWGFIAQDVAEAMLKNGYETPEDGIVMCEDPNGLGLRYSDIFTLNVRATQELMTELAELRSELSSLKEELRIRSIIY